MPKKLMKFVGITLLTLFILTSYLGFETKAKSNKKPHSQLELTIYNNNLALVKEKRQLQLKPGISKVNFSNVSAQIDPTSVRFRSLTSPKIQLLEQNYQYDIISDTKLLEKYLGQKIKLTTPKGAEYSGFLLSTGSNLILGQTPQGGQIQVIKAQEIATLVFPELRGGLITKPTLVWVIKNPFKQKRRHLAEISYLTKGVSWKADYVATINSSDSQIDLTGWVTINNNCGIPFRQARLKLIAGEVKQVPQAVPYRKKLDYLAAAENGSAKSFQEEPFFEYHLYSLQRTTSLGNNQIKQLELLAAPQIKVQKYYVFEGRHDSRKVKVILAFKNSARNNLGIPLPKGRIRLQKADPTGSLQFIGEAQIDHTPQNQKLRLHIGNAFDLTGKRIKTDVKTLRNKAREETYQIKLKNHKKTAVRITINEELRHWSAWQIIRSSHRYTKTSAKQIKFDVKISPRQEKTVTYTVRYKHH